MTLSPPDLLQTPPRFIYASALVLNIISLEPADILEKIVLFSGKKIEPGKTFLFFDEVQDCPQAIMALRYFYEEMPSLHVIAAGSLVEFALESENFRMPVGRIQYIYLFPM